MKKIIFTLSFMLFAATAFSQNVGIGTATPAFKLDVKGGSINTDSLYRIGGNSVLSVKGTANLFAGVNSGFTTSTGNSNTGIGTNALYSNSNGNFNTAIGRDALRGNAGGEQNTAIGMAALYANAYGKYNTAIGVNSMYSNIGGDYNTAVGTLALNKNTSGRDNTANGSLALFYNTTGHFNSATGSAALFSNTTGNYNSATGNGALFSLTTGTGNTATGTDALKNTFYSSYNTAIGFAAGDAGINMGWNNTMIGSYSRAEFHDIFNSIAVGNAASVSASNQARIGNSSTSSIGGYANWTNISDGRFKKNIHEDVKGIDFIMKLRPVTYQLDLTALSERLNENKKGSWNEEMKKGMAEKEKMIQSGFIAQEVEGAAKAAGYDFSGVDKPKNEKDLYGLRYAEFVVPLVKAVQQQQQQLNETKKEISLLKEQNKILLELLSNKK